MRLYVYRLRVGWKQNKETKEIIMSEYDAPFTTDRDRRGYSCFGGGCLSIIIIVLIAIIWDWRIALAMTIPSIMAIGFFAWLIYRYTKKGDNL